MTRREGIDVEEAEEEVFEDTEEHPAEEGVAEQPQTNVQKAASKHQRTSSEVDYGIEKAHPNGGAQNTVVPAKQEKQTAPTPTPATKPPQPTATSTPRSPPPVTASRTHLSPPAQTPRRPISRKSTSKPSSQNALLAQARALFAALSNLATNMTGALQKNPTAMLRFLLFALMFVGMASQKVVREKLRRVLERAWEKMRGTVGMGVKVSYI